jgi:integration host factor subunit alpha
MSTKTLTRADLTEAVFNAVGLSRNESSQMVEDILEEVCGALSARRDGQAVVLRHLPGAPEIAACGRNPRPETKFRSRRAGVSVFRPSHVLKAQINGLDGVGADEGTE